MKTNSRPAKMVGAVFTALLMAANIAAASDAAIEAETMKRLAVLRAIKPEGGREDVDRYNRQMDEAWKFFNANKKAVLPLLRRELSAELRKDDASQLVLLDIGYFIRLQDSQADKTLGRQTLFAIDPDAEIVRWNRQQLFHFAHAVVPDRDRRTLPFLDKTFLRGNVTAFIPQHAMQLDETLVCVFLYGVFGTGAEEHLKSQLSDPAVVNRIIEILIWIGSPESVPEVAAAMEASRDYDTFVRATAFMMSAGGPKGRSAMLAVRTESFDAKSRQYYAKVRGSMEAVTYEALRDQFRNFPDPGRISDAELKKRLAAMHRNYGKDDDTSPRAFLISELPRTYLIAELSRIRSRMLFRLSDEALSDVKITNALLNALHYKP